LFFGGDKTCFSKKQMKKKKVLPKNDKNQGADEENKTL